MVYNQNPSTSLLNVCISTDNANTERVQAQDTGTINSRTMKRLSKPMNAPNLTDQPATLPAVRCSDLLACPFCGLTDKDSVSPDMAYVPAVSLNQWPHSTFAVQCEGCGCSGPLDKTGEGAVQQWNTRKQANEKAQP